MADTYERLSMLFAKAMAEARGNEEKKAEIIEMLAGLLGRAIAVFADGDSSLIDMLATGAEAYMVEEAARLAPLAQILAGGRHA